MFIEVVTKLAYFCVGKQFTMSVAVSFLLLDMYMSAEEKRSA